MAEDGFGTSAAFIADEAPGGFIEIAVEPRQNHGALWRAGDGRKKMRGGAIGAG